VKLSFDNAKVKANTILWPNDIFDLKPSREAIYCPA
jgi:hypothetical protein